MVAEAMGRKGMLLGSGSGSNGRAAQTQGTGECVVHEVVLSQEGKADGRDGRWSTAGLYCTADGTAAWNRAWGGCRLTPLVCTESRRSACACSDVKRADTGSCSLSIKCGYRTCAFTR
jgi:hypothetical protein